MFKQSRTSVDVSDAPFSVSEIFITHGIGLFWARDQLVAKTVINTRDKHLAMPQRDSNPGTKRQRLMPYMARPPTSACISSTGLQTSNWCLYCIQGQL